jgi:hypothetical protein
MKRSAWLPGAFSCRMSISRMQQSLTTVLPAVVNWPFVYFSTSGLLARPVTAFTCFTLPDQMLKHTALFDAHRKRNAKLVDFGGWEMPLHYGSQIAEHHSVRRDAGMFDVSHMLAIDVLGKGARSFLLELLANNVDRLKRPGKALYACMLNSQACGQCGHCRKGHRLDNAPA